MIIVMTREFWESEGSDFTVSPVDVSTNPNGVIDPFVTVFIRVEFSFSSLIDDLSEIDGVEIAPRDSLHITVKMGREVAKDELPDISKKIESSLEEFTPFTIALRGVNVFPNCVYIPAVDEEHTLESVHQSLCSISEFIEGEFEGLDYIPHMTLAKFSSWDVDTSELYSVLSDYQDKDWGEIEVSRVYLVKDIPSENGVFPQFDVVRDFTLEPEH